MKGKTVVVGTIGVDAHVVGAWVLKYALSEEGFNVVNLGACVSQQEFIDAAIETKADAILVSSIYGHGIIDCEGLRDKCDESGLKDILLYVGGNLVVDARGGSWDQVEAKFKEMGFSRVYPPETLPETAIADLKNDLGLLPAKGSRSVPIQKKGGRRGAKKSQAKR